jgi:hypothetical protein
MADTLFSSAYKKAAPLNARILIETLLGKTTPITEKDLTQDELQALYKLYESKQASNQKKYQSLVDQLNITKKEWSKAPTTVAEYKDGAMVERKETFSQYQARIRKQIESFNKTQNKTSVNYYDYTDKGTFGAPVNDSLLKAIYSSYTDPQYRLKTTLGSFNVLNTPQGAMVKDKYNFDAARFYDIEPETTNLDLVTRFYNRPLSLVDALLIKNYPAMNRPVNISLPPRAPVMYSDPFEDTTR